MTARIVHYKACLATPLGKVCFQQRESVVLGAFVEGSGIFTFANDHTVLVSCCAGTAHTVVSNLDTPRPCEPPVQHCTTVQLFST